MPQSPPAPDPQFILGLWCDLSLTTGYSINERESASALLSQFPERIRVVSPRPAFPEIFSDPRIDYVYNHRRNHPLHYPRFLAEFYHAIRNLRSQFPDAALVFRLGPLPIVPAWAVRSGAPVILKKLGAPAGFVPKDRHWIRQLIASSAAPLYKYIARGCLGADVESAVYGDWLRSVLPIPSSKMAVVRNGANTDFFRPQDQTECRRRHGWDDLGRIVGYVGSIDALRCVDAILAAARQLQDVSDLSFVLVGDGPLVEPLRRQLAREGLEKRFLLPGFVPYTDIPSVMNAFDVAVDLSKVPFRMRGTIQFGSYSQKISQYLACGVPVVTWETEDTRFLTDEGIGRTVPIEDTASLANVLRELLADCTPERPIQSKVREFACRELSADVIAQQRMAFWNELLDPSDRL